MGTAGRRSSRAIGFAVGAQRACRIRRGLLAWFRDHARDLPWRGTRDPYRVWLSEILLQQTRVETVRPYYERFLNAFPTVGKLAAAPLDRVLKVWEGLGYYTRARHMHAAARMVVREWDGRFPSTVDALRRLPGVGPYTAGAVASIAFGRPAAVLDGNVKRVLARVLAIQSPIDEAGTVRRLWRAAGELVPSRGAGQFNQAMMDFGAAVCVPRRPRCLECPIRSLCASYASGTQGRIPVRRRNRPRPHHEIVAAVVRRNDRLLLGRRRPEGLLGGLWELPGGKVKEGETHQAALTRELREELGIRATIGPLLARVGHAYSHFSITMYVYTCHVRRGRPRPLYHTRLRWVSLERLGDYATPAATRRVLCMLQRSGTGGMGPARSRRVNRQPRGQALPDTRACSAAR